MIAIQNVKADVDSFVVPDEYTRHLIIIRQDFRLQDHVVGFCDMIAKFKL